MAATVPVCAHLRASVSLQGATGSQLGGFVLRNTGRGACVVRIPLRVERLDAHGRRLPLAWTEANDGLGYRSLRLGPGRAATAELQLMNACSTKGELWVVTGGRRFDLHIPPEGRCDSPPDPPTAYVGGLDLVHVGHAPHVLRVVGISAPASARRGSTITYRVTVANPTAHAWRGRALYGEQLLLLKVVATRQRSLPLRTYAPHSRTTFLMRMPAPNRADRAADLEWSLLDYAEPIAPLVDVHALLGGPINLATYSWKVAQVSLR